MRKDLGSAPAARMGGCIPGFCTVLGLHGQLGPWRFNNHLGGQPVLAVVFACFSCVRVCVCVKVVYMCKSVDQAGDSVS